MTAGQIAIGIIAVYLLVLLLLGILSNRVFRGTAADYFLASRGVGSVVLLLSVFGTTMTAFAMQGSSGEAWQSGIVVFGKMASWSGIVHSACFFLVGIKLWALGRRYGYVTQIQFFRERFESDGLGLLLFPLLVALVMIYILMGVIGSGKVISTVTQGALPQLFAHTKGGVPYWLATGTVCLVVLAYVFFGGVRGTAWANAFQTFVFVIVGIITFAVIADKLGGPAAATRMVQEYNPTKLKRGKTEQDVELYKTKLAAFESSPRTSVIKPHPPKDVSQLEFLSYGLIPLSVAMFPHLFQLWLTARSARTFRLTVVAHPVLIMIVWLPCVLIGVWATSAIFDGRAVIPPEGSPNANAILAIMVSKLAAPALGGLLAAGILAAIVGGLDAQFLCVGSMFTHDILAHHRRAVPLNDTQLLRAGRLFVVLVVAASYLLSLWLTESRTIFPLGIWCFSGFAGLFPLVFGALYWRRATKAGAYASTLTTVIVWIWLFQQSNYGKADEVLVLGVLPVIWIVGASAAALVVVSLLTAVPSPGTVAKFFGTSADGR